MTSQPDRRSNWQRRWYQLVRSVTRVQSARGEQQLLDWLVQPGEPLMMAFVNAHAMNAAAASEEFFNTVISADLLLRDGIGMALLLRLLNRSPGLNLNGTDLIPRILRRCAGRPIAFFGTRDPYLAQAQAAVVTQIAPGSRCITAHGFLDTPTYLRLAASYRPGVIVLGMGMPRQEEVAVSLRAALGFPCLIICGGAIIDFLGNKTPRAPNWIRRIGFEWLFRLALEPKRLFTRYVIGNPVFVFRALSLAVQSHRHHNGMAA